MTTSPHDSHAVSAALAVRLKKTLSRDFTLDVAFTLQPGVTVLFGPSGAGKTSILQLLAGIAHPDSGRVALGERVLFDSAQRVDLPPQSRRVGYVFQHLALFPHFTALENVMYGLAHLAPAERQQRARLLMDEVFGIGRLASRRVTELSGGERQRVALARALAPRPDFLLLDEPLSALDDPTKSRILHELLSWTAHNPIPILYVTHDREEIFSAAQHVVVIEQGSIAAEGTPDAALLNPRTLQVARSAVFENIFRARVVSEDSASGTMQCEIGGVVLDCPLAFRSREREVSIAVRAGDILLATEHPRGLSARNILEGAISRLTRREQVVAVEVRCGSGEHHVTFVSHVTPQAVSSLALAEGRTVWIVLKTHSCHILRD